MPDGAEDRQDQAERGDRLTDPLAKSGARLHRHLQRRQVEHQMRGPGAEDSKGELGEDVGCGVAPAKLAARCGHQADRRVHMRARDRAEHGDQHEQDRAGRQRIAEQGNRHVSARQPLGHDAGADHAGEQEKGAKPLRCDAAA